MIPNDTHHHSLMVYADFLEENGEDTQELRESFFENRNNWEFINLANSDLVGINSTAPSLNTIGLVGSMSGSFGRVWTNVTCAPFMRNTGSVVGFASDNDYCTFHVGTQINISNDVGSIVYFSRVANTDTGGMQ